MKKRSFILAAVALLLALAMAVTGCAAATDSGPSTDTINSGTMTLDENAVVTIPGIGQAFAEGYDPVYYVGTTVLTDGTEEADWLLARPLVPEGKTLIISSFTSRAGDNKWDGSLTNKLTSQDLIIKGNLKIEHQDAKFIVDSTSQKTEIWGALTVEKGTLTNSGAITQTGGSVAVSGGSLTNSGTWAAGAKSRAGEKFDITVSAGSFTNTGTLSNGGGALTTSGGSVTNNGVLVVGAVTANVPIAGTGTTIAASYTGAGVVAGKEPIQNVTTVADITTAFTNGATTVIYKPEAPTDAGVSIDVGAGKQVVVAANENLTGVTGAGTLVVQAGATVTAVGNGPKITLGATTPASLVSTTKLLVLGAVAGAVTAGNNTDRAIVQYPALGISELIDAGMTLTFSGKTMTYASTGNHSAVWWISAGSTVTIPEGVTVTVSASTGPGTKSVWLEAGAVLDVRGTLNGVVQGGGTLKLPNLGIPSFTFDEADNLTLSANKVVFKENSWLALTGNGAVKTFTLPAGVTWDFSASNHPGYSLRVENGARLVANGTILAANGLAAATDGVYTSNTNDFTVIAS